MPRSRWAAALRVSGASGCVRANTSYCHRLSRLGSTAVENLPTERSGFRAIEATRGWLPYGMRSRGAAVSARLDVLDEVIEKLALASGVPGALAGGTHGFGGTSSIGSAGAPRTDGEEGSGGGSTMDADGVSGRGKTASSPTGLALKSGCSSNERSQ